MGRRSRGARAKVGLCMGVPNMAPFLTILLATTTAALPHKTDREVIGRLGTHDQGNPVWDQQKQVSSGRMLGLDTGNPAADAEAEMWIMALIGTLAAAIPVAFLNPSLGFRRKRSEGSDEEAETTLAVLRREGELETFIKSTK